MGEGRECSFILFVPALFSLLVLEKLEIFETENFKGREENSTARQLRRTQVAASSSST
jgi:hypothetical protein